VLIIEPRAIQILAELTRSYVERGVGLHFAHLRPTHSDVFRLVGITDLVSVSTGLTFQIQHHARILDAWL
jgi:hypothetical protein